MNLRRLNLITNKHFRQALLVFIIIALPSLLLTGDYIISDSPVPEDGMEENPYPNEQMSEGMLFIVIDGGRKDMMSNPDFMPKLNERVKLGAYLEVETNPITMTASCVKEIATGVPSRPNEGLNNFHPVHPGTPDGWNLASTHDGDGDGLYDHQVGILGDYVWRDLYPDREIIPFAKHRYGHADFYQGDEEGFETMYSWLGGDAPEGYDRAPNIIIAHLSGLDSIGHRYGSKGATEYEDKLKWLDDKMDIAFKLVPDNWTVAVTSDHGLTDTGQHGSDEPIIRETAGFIWGPSIAQGVKIDDVAQRDWATLPSIIFGLPLPHAISGQIPLDAFDLTEEQRQEYEQWNWDAAVERNEWMEENGHPYIEGLSKENIEWDNLRGDDIGMRDIDVIISCIAIVIFAAYLFKTFSSVKELKKYSIIAAGSAITLFTFSALISYNRDTQFFLYYNLGLIGMPILYLASKKAFKKDSVNSGKRLTMFMMLLFFVLIFPETRFTVLLLPLLVSVFLVMENKLFVSKDNSTPNRLIIPMFAILFTTLFFSDQRIHGFAISRKMIYLTLSYEYEAVIYSVIIAFVSTLIFATRYRQNNWPTIIALSSVMATLPVLVSQDSNNVDWIMISGLVAGLLASIVARVMNKPSSYSIFLYTSFAWLIMSWGAWAGGVSMISYACIDSLMQKEWKNLKINPEPGFREYGRQTVLGLLPIGIWFAWWASMGQIDGILHPRDVDPGNLFLKGGYIGDRLSPSNTWVFFMGAGPVILMGTLWWNMFRINKWPLQIALALLAIRIAGLSMQLSFSPSLPRLVFKIGWDILFCMILLLVGGLFVLYGKWLESEQSQINSESKS